jgi:folate-binding protein YgfZ
VIPLPEDLRHVLAGRGANFGEVRGRESALDFGSMEAEYEALTRDVALVELAGRTKIEFVGADRVRFLNNLTTNDLRNLKPGDSIETFLTTVQGKTLSHGYVCCGNDALVYETTPDQAARLLPHFEKYRVREQVEFCDRSDDWAEIVVAGPKAKRVVSFLFYQGIGDGHETETPPNPRPYVRHRVFGRPDAFLVSYPRLEIAGIWLMFTADGALPCGHTAFEAARIEAGFPLYDVDISDDNLPQEVSRDAQAISFKKGCYLGQETVARIDALGHVNRTLVQVQFTGTEVPSAGTELSAEGKPVGRVTSAAWSPRLKAPLALAYVRRGHNAPGARLDSPRGAAEVVRLPTARSGS